MCSCASCAAYDAIDLHGFTPHAATDISRCDLVLARTLSCFNTLPPSVFWYITRAHTSVLVLSLGHALALPARALVSLSLKSPSRQFPPVDSTTVSFAESCASRCAGAPRPHYEAQALSFLVSLF